jgi:hypothetical protein
MKRSWNWLLWIGFLLMLAAPTSYMLVFVWHPITRDFPWVSLLMFAAGAVWLVMGLVRAFRQPQLYRGRIFGSVLTVLGLAVFGVFAFGLFYLGRQLPRSDAAPHVGQKAPDFTLTDQNGKSVSLSRLLSEPIPGTSTKPKGALLIFYRGHW